jgi:vitamin B12 transporter
VQTWILLFILQVLRGTVVDPARLPVVGAIVQLKGTETIAITDEAGHFTLEAPTKSVLIVSMPGFQSREIEFQPRIQLELSHVSEEVSVQTTMPGRVEPGTFAISPLDVVRTPGSQADIFRAIQSLPGVTRVDDGAGLFVRGGDTNELLVLLDGAAMAHPYRYETPTGGFRGAIDPFMTEGLAFSAGGFSARYGNALSGVLDLRGLGRPEVVQTSVTAGLAGVSGSLASPLGDHAGFRFGAQRTTPRLLFAVNPSPRQFDQYPGGWDVAGNASLVTKALGTVKFFGIDQRDHVGVELEKDTFLGFLHSSSQHRLLSGSWRKPLNKAWQASGAFGDDRYAGTLDVGIQKLNRVDHHHSGRFDLEGRLGVWNLHTGVDSDFSDESVDGSVPIRGGDFGGTSGSIDFRVGHDDWHAGSHIEGSRTIGRFTPTIGVRTDRFGAEHQTTIDPRASLVFKLDSNQRLRAAWGLFHQAPSPLYFDSVRGSKRLPPMSATHYVVGYELGAPEAIGLFRVEGYYKRYDSLPLEQADGSYNAEGYGSAEGVDIFARRAWTHLELRAGASWLKARRRWTPVEQRDRYPMPSGTWAPDFAIPLSTEVVANIPIAGPISAGTSFNVASGRPSTPVIGAKRTLRGYEPIYGTINSERLPRYQRLDLSSSALFPIRGGGVLILFASVDNVLGRQNFFEYAWSADYSVRHPVITASPRSFYFGMSVTK